MDTPLFLVFLAVHIISLIVGMGAVFLIDTFGLLWLLGKMRLSFVVRVAHVTQWLIWLGWTGLVLSGTGLIVLKGYIDSLTMIKLFFVALLGANGIFLHGIKKTMEAFAEQDVLPLFVRFRIGLSSGISQLGWWGAAAIGFLHRHWQHRIDWPEAPELYMIGIIVLILATALMGEILLRREKRMYAST